MFYTFEDMNQIMFSNALFISNISLFIIPIFHDK